MFFGIEVGTVNFTPIREIGQHGRNSIVYLATDHQLDAELVIKKIDKNTFTGIDQYFQEAKILYDVSHGNIVGVRYACQNADHVFIAMPFYNNGSLKDLITNRYLTIREVVRYGVQFLTGLHHIHSKGLIHFDIKPDNILLSDSDEALLSDFGLAKSLDAAGFARRGLVYSKHVPPEIFTRDDHSIQYDIYAAGVTLYRLLNGTEKFNFQFDQLLARGRDALIESIAKGLFPLRTEYLAHIPNNLRRLVNKAMDIEPNKRHTNVLELINELSAVSDNLDWRYSEEPDTQIWRWDQDTKTVEIRLISNGRSFDIQTSKFIKASGNSQRITKFCQSNVTDKASRDLLKEALASDDL